MFRHGFARFLIPLSILSICFCLNGTKIPVNSNQSATPPVPALPSNGATGQPVSLSLIWDSVAGATSYSVQVSTTTGFSSTVFSQTGLPAVSDSISGLAPGTTYYWEVNTANASGAGAWSGSWSFTTLSPLPVAPTLAMPTSGASIQAMSLTISWGTVANAASYSVRVSTVSTFSTTVLSQAGLNNNNESLGGLAAGAAYYWEASATDSAGTGAWSGVWSFTVMSPIPIAPTLASPASGAVNLDSSLTMSWGTVANATSYSLQVSTVLTFSSTVLSQTGLTNAFDSIGGLAPGATYFWEVSAADAAGAGPWSGSWSFSTLPAIPAAPTLTLPTSGAVNLDTSLTLNWGSVSGAASYGVMVSTVSTFSSTVVSQAGVANDSDAIGGLAGGTVYFWEVNATNAAGSGAWSGPWSFTTVAPLGKKR
jgi:hypothetical protein